MKTRETETGQELRMRNGNRRWREERPENSRDHRERERERPRSRVHVAAADVGDGQGGHTRAPRPWRKENEQECVRPPRETHSVHTAKARSHTEAPQHEDTDRERQHGHFVVKPSGFPTETPGPPGGSGSNRGGASFTLATAGQRPQPAGDGGTESSRDFRTQKTGGFDPVKLTSTQCGGTERPLTQVQGTAPTRPCGRTYQKSEDGELGQNCGGQSSRFTQSKRKPGMESWLRRNIRTS